MLQKIFATGFALCTTLFAFSQETSVAVNNATPPSTETKTEAPPEEKKPALTISGSADVYFRYNTQKQAPNNKTSFTNSRNSFALGMASVKLEHTGSKVGAVLDLGFGTRAQEFAYNETGIFSAVKQAYVSYSPAKDLKFTVGTWATHVGYELVDPQLNRNYSMSYMFTNGPFTHTGLKAEYAKGKSTFMLGLSNATDYRIPPAGKINKKFLIAQYSIAATDKLKFYANFVGGKAPDTSIVNQFDIVGTYTVSSKFSIGVNGTLNRSQVWDGGKSAEAKNWYGFAGYFNYDPTAAFGLTWRSEYFNDEKAVKGLGTTIFANTLSANFKAEGFMFIPEIRYEAAGASIYADSKGAFNQKNTLSFILAVVYKF
ncbi:MAG: porin [Chitinophagaceae bacterium]|nr:porin [Chitinophagaceae bacterium]